MASATWRLSWRSPLTFPLGTTSIPASTRTISFVNGLMYGPGLLWLLIGLRVGWGHGYVLLGIYDDLPVPMVGNLAEISLETSATAELQKNYHKSMNCAWREGTLTYPEDAGPGRETLASGSAPESLALVSLEPGESNEPKILVTILLLRLYWSIYIQRQEARRRYAYGACMQHMAPKISPFPPFYEPHPLLGTWGCRLYYFFGGGLLIFFFFIISFFFLLGM